jgi:hypothetical protein
MTRIFKLLGTSALTLGLLAAPTFAQDSESG